MPNRRLNSFSLCLFLSLGTIACPPGSSDAPASAEAPAGTGDGAAVAPAGGPGTGATPVTGEPRPAGTEPGAPADAPSGSGAGSAVRAEAVYIVSPPGSSIVAIGAKITRTHEITFGDFAGEVRLVNGDPLQSRANVTIQMASLQSDTERLTGHLRTGDFFDVERFPTASFTTTSIAPLPGDNMTHTVTGDLRLKDVTQSVSFPAAIHFTPEEASLTAEFSIDRRLWGITYPGMADDLIRDEVTIRLDIHASAR